MPSIERIVTLAAIAAAHPTSTPGSGGAIRSTVNRRESAGGYGRGRRRHCRAIKARWLIGACAFALMAVWAPPAMGDDQARGLELNALQIQFTSFTCLNLSCSLARVTVAGKATSNLGTGAGSNEATLMVDLSPGGSCMFVDESSTFSFAEGTIFVHSHHEDCATHGLRVDTTFDVTGGTGVFQGASGSGRELSAAAQPGLDYIGTITF